MAIIWNNIIIFDISEENILGNVDFENVSSVDDLRMIFHTFEVNEFLKMWIFVNHFILLFYYSYYLLSKEDFSIINFTYYIEQFLNYISVTNADSI